MGPFFQGVFGLTAGGPGGEAAAQRDGVADQLVTLLWSAALAAVAWLAPAEAGPWPVTGMAAGAAGYACWRLARLVPLYRKAASLPGRR